jgi:hypothetical protein
MTGRIRIGRNEQQTRQKRVIEGLQRLAHRFGDWPAAGILRAARNRWRKLGSKA